MASVTLQNLTKAYAGGTLKAVDNVSIEVQDGEFLVLVGPSGCGKSTALRMIAGLEEITDGAVWIGDQFVNDVHPKDRDIAMVFQSYALYPHMSVYDNIAFPLQIARMPKDEIDKRVIKNELNALEREVATRLIEAAPAVDKIIADGKRMFSQLGARFPQCVSMDRAEEAHASVAAASKLPTT